jgi:hypothetical protein
VAVIRTKESARAAQWSRQVQKIASSTFQPLAKVFLMTTVRSNVDITSALFSLISWSKMR